MYIQDHLKKRLGTGYQETEQLGFQCVAYCKLFAKEVLGVTLGTFGGTALTGWYNQSNTFNPEIWERIENDPTDPAQVPQPGDIMFFSGPTYAGHVGVVKEANKGEYTFKLINQNNGSGDGKGDDDKIQVDTFDYKLCLGWYRKKGTSPFEHATEYRGVPVERQKEYWFASGGKQYQANALYKVDRKVIILADILFQSSIEQQHATMKHEFGHAMIRQGFISIKHLTMYRDLWKFESKLVNRISGITNIKYQNAYINWNDKRKFTESFCECLEYQVLVDMGAKEMFDERDWRYVRVRMANRIFDLAMKNK